MRLKNSKCQSGRIRLELLVVAVIISFLAVVLLDRLREVQLSAERQLVDADAMALRTELQLAVLSAINRGEEATLAGWAGRDPFELAGRKEGRRLSDSAGGARLGGDWRWLPERGVLLYEDSQGRQVSLRIVRSAAGSGGGWGLGGGLLLIREERYEKRQ